ncbi:DUF3325 family protein [Gilvimarinus sp. DA14]|uniref:DUF3325 family protein n=1 Tax=Gilvimarinus sp. DA14 TaxID=2956798 RepID=UPI0020B8FC45|nr:DUF3325 family protein [Gilvimarinus sp. DA14]UTF60647.1 DUF3325 family protein [Gilvimarinus sp. DA14]
MNGILSFSLLLLCAAAFTGFALASAKVRWQLQKTGSSFAITPVRLRALSWLLIIIACVFALNLRSLGIGLAQLAGCASAAAIVALLAANFRPRLLPPLALGFALLASLMSTASVLVSLWA